MDDRFRDSLLLDAMREENPAEDVQVDDLVQGRVLVDLWKDPDPTSLPFGIVVLSGNLTDLWSIEHY